MMHRKDRTRSNMEDERRGVRRLCCGAPSPVEERRTEIIFFLLVLWWWGPQSWVVFFSFFFFFFFFFSIDQRTPKERQESPFVRIGEERPKNEFFFLNQRMYLERSDWTRKSSTFFMT